MKDRKPASTISRNQSAVIARQYSQPHVEPTNSSNVNLRRYELYGLSRMTPYYEQDGIVIYHGDAADVLPFVDADCLITDSPYGINLGKEGRDHRLATEPYASYDDSPGNYRDVLVPIIVSAIAQTTRAAVFAPFRQLTYLPQPAAVGGVYNRAGAGRSNWGFTVLHLVYFYGNNPNIANGCYPTVFEDGHITVPNGHPCPKPIEWMRWLVNFASLHGETVLDCFAGSGTTLVAAKQLGRKAIGIELEEQYCEIAAKRLSQGALPLEMDTVTAANAVERNQSSDRRRGGLISAPVDLFHE